MSAGPAPGWRRDAVAVFAAALAARLGVVAWAAGRFPPTADGEFYHRVATRIAEGLGYTWAWPDGAVTYAAHYPVGYPGAVGAVYALIGPHPVGAMALNAALGALGALAVHRLAARAGSRGIAALAGALVALHPGLVAYTPALMTEGATTSLLACAAWVAAWARDRRAASRSLGPFVTLGAVMGLATLVRPQSLLLAPVFAWIAGLGLEDAYARARASSTRPRPGSAPLRWARRAAPALVATAAALAMCAPWTARNCARMGQCALVSVNAGWNLLIGADPAAGGTWAPLQVPDACRDVFDEAGKDACFGREARRAIAERPAAWVALAPRKLAATFDYCGAAGWYLHASSPEAFGDREKLALGAVETAYERIVLILCLVWAFRGAGRAGAASSPPRRGLGQRALVLARHALLLVGVLSVLHVHAWVGHLALLGLALLQGRALLRAPVLPLAALAVLAATALTHAVFFGAGRYAMVTFPLLTGLAALGLARAGREGREGREGRAGGQEDGEVSAGAPGLPADSSRDFDSAARSAAS